MASLYLCALLLWAADQPVDPAVAQAQEQVTGEQSRSRPLHEIHRAMRAVMRAEAAEADASRWAAAVARLALIYGEIMRDARLPDSPTLAGYRVKVRARLLSIQKDLERDLERQGKDLPHDPQRDQAHPRWAPIRGRCPCRNVKTRPTISRRG